MTGRFSQMLRRAPFGAIVLALCAYAGLVPRVSSAQGDPDASWASYHPRLFFSSADLPALRAKVHDGGADDDAYAFVRQKFTDDYLAAPYDTLLSDDFALDALANTGLAAYLENPIDSLAIDLGRRLTLYIARAFDVDTDAYASSLRLRALALGYDLFFGPATSGEQAEVRDETAGYLSYMTYNMNYDIWRWRPYVSNKTAMVAATLGLASICMRDEIDAGLAGAALARADQLYAAWRDAHLVSDGAYSEGTLYATWSLRHLIYYFEARRRFDGFDYGSDGSIRAVERWFPYELDPRGGARLNNIQDQTDYFFPLARHTTYWDWAMHTWGSGIAAYVWEHAAGAYGRDMGDSSDKFGTVLWHESVAPVNPAAVLPASQVWQDRGLYYFRTGWPDGAASEDVVFSFYSGQFRGGHAQEDQNQFTLTAYGEKLVTDNGSGSQAKQSEAHNLVLIDGMGQHNAGSSIGTDGCIESFVLGGFADYVLGDATLAYSTHSPYNNAGVPYAWSDWSWGLTGANPVLRALRRVIAVHRDGVAPYFVIQDDIQKDDAVHHYDWCLHVPDAADVDLSGSIPAHVALGAAVLDVHVVTPPPSLIARSVALFDNQCEDPNTNRIMLSTDAVAPGFTFILAPRRAADPTPAVSTQSDATGTTTTLAWPGGTTDFVLVRKPVEPGGAPERRRILPGAAYAGSLGTDGTLGVVRISGGSVTGYIVADASLFERGTTEVVRIEDGPASFAYDGTRVHLSRRDAQFRIRAEGVDEVVYRGEHIPTMLDGDYLTNALPTGSGDAPAAADLALRAFPNPFNPSVRVSFVTRAPARVRADIHDAAGRRVDVLASRTMEAGEHILAWDGRDAWGNPVSSGVYFLRVRAGRSGQTIKLVLLR